MAILRAKRAQERPGTPAATNSAILDSILTDWAQLSGLKYSGIDAPQASGSHPEFADEYARANDYGLCHATRAGAHTDKSGSLPTGNKARVICGAKRRRDGQPCQGLSVPL